MKKIFTFCAALFVAISAMAVVNVAPVKMEMTEGAKAALKQKCAMTQATCQPEAVLTRAYTDPATGITYDAYLYNLGYNWPDMFDKTAWYNQFPDFESFPFFTAQCILVSDNEPVTDQLSFLMCWPSYWSGGLVEKGGTDWDKFAPLDAFGGNETPDWEVLEYGYLGAWGIFNGCWTEWENTWKGKKGYVAQGGTLNISNFDAEEDFCNIAFRGTLNQMGENGKEGPVVTAYNLMYSGTVHAAGFYPIPKVREFSEVHIINTGAVTGDNDEWFEYLGYWDEDWGPLQRFYFIALCEDVTMASNAWEVNKYDISSERVYLKEGVTNDNSVGVSYVKGALYCQEGTDMPNVLWDQAWFTFEYKGAGWEQVGCPSAGDLITSEYNSDYANSCPFLRNDCIVSIWKNDFFDLGKNSDLKIGNGTTQGFYIAGKDAYDNVIYLDYKGDIIYHYDEDNLELTREIPAVGDLEPHEAVNTVAADGNKIFAANGTITVEVAQDGVVAVYAANGALINKVAAKAGQTVNVNAAKGLYIVKAGNTAKKVVL